MVPLTAALHYRAVTLFAKMACELLLADAMVGPEDELRTRGVHRDWEWGTTLPPEGDLTVQFFRQGRTGMTG